MAIIQEDIYDSEIKGQLNVKNMLKNNCTSHTSTTRFGTLFLLLINFHVSSNASGGGGSSVKFLPGFDGPLPFHLETGYIGVGEAEEVQLFYYFIESENNPTNDPLLLWFSGGPGCSSLFGLLFEIGPIKFEEGVNVQYYQEGMPKLVLNPYSWTQIASVIFIDLPVGTGFSYATNTKAAQSDFLQSSYHAHQFIRKWLVDHPQFVSNQVYVGGVSSSGITVPIITQLISEGNDIGLEPKINLKSLKEACSGNYYDIDPTNRRCLQNMNTFNELLDGIYEENILEPSCPDVSRPRKLLGETKYQSDIVNLEIRNEQDFPIKCRPDGYKLLDLWANDKTVQDAIHIRQGITGEWKRCRSDLPFNKSITNVVPYHTNLGNNGYRSLIYSGDHDFMIPFISTEAWIRSLNYSIVDNWRPWIVEGQVAGYTRTYANKMTFATVKGAGHVAPEYKPRQCIAMFNKWISNQPL